MKLELTIKHLAPYLPYGLNLFIIDEKLVSKLELLGDYVRLDVESDFDFHEVKPILRPLSDLKNSDLEFTEYFKSRFDMDEWGDLSDVPYSDMEKLFKHHFDVSELIEQGLAIDINTLEL